MKLTTTAQNLRTHARDYNDNQLPYPVFDENTAQADAGNLGSDAVHNGTGDDGRIIAVDAGGVQLPDDTALVYERGRLGRGIVGGGEGAAGERCGGIPVGSG